jgi:hypothetical protein
LGTTNPENDSAIMKEAEERWLPRLAKVHNCLEMWQEGQNLSPTIKARTPTLGRRRMMW